MGKHSRKSRKSDSDSDSSSSSSESRNSRRSSKKGGNKKGAVADSRRSAPASENKPGCLRRTFGAFFDLVHFVLFVGIGVTALIALVLGAVAIARLDKEETANPNALEWPNNDFENPCVEGDVWERSEGLVNRPYLVTPPTGDGEVEPATFEVCMTCRPAVTYLEELRGNGEFWKAPLQVTYVDDERTGNCYSVSTVQPARVGVFPLRLTLDNTAILKTFEVSCSDGLFCNGLERFINGKCVSDVARPCGQDNDDDCERYACDDETARCELTPVGGDTCVSCQDPAACTPDCSGRECGSDGCAGTCGSCPNGEYCDGTGTCGAPGFGSCFDPRPIWHNSGAFTIDSATPHNIAQTIVDGSDVIPSDGVGAIVRGVLSSADIDAVDPTCNIPGVPETVYRFVLTQPSGFNILVRNADMSGDLCDLDTLLAVHQINGDGNCLDPIEGVPAGLCNDEGNPLGICASRVFGVLPAGTYAIIVTGYSPVEGEFLLNLNFNGVNARPECEARTCGDDETGHECIYQWGDCGVDGTCVKGQCEDTLCVPECDGRNCGPAPNCPSRFSCGTCTTAGTECALEIGTCLPADRSCDRLAPVCTDSPPDTENYYCGVNCQWFHKDEILPDLLPNNGERVYPTITFFSQFFVPETCALTENCIAAAGQRQLMRFATVIHNQALVGVDLPSPLEDTAYNTWSSCHKHYHSDNFADIGLFDVENNRLSGGTKLSFCILDSNQHLFGPLIPCTGIHGCGEDQGLLPGWEDEYTYDLDCQWVDITDLERDKWYVMQVHVNPSRLFMEADFSNNLIRFPVWVPSFADDEYIEDYAQYLADNADSIPEPPVVA